MQILSIIRIVGILVICFSGTMLAPAFVALIYDDGGGTAFIETFVMSLSAGLLLWWWCRRHKAMLRARESFLIVVLFWVLLGSLGAIPFLLFDSQHFTMASAFFESFSGLTTTGATVLVGLDEMPKALLFYRQFLQWLGGMGIIVLAVAIMPLLGIGGMQMQMYRAETSVANSEKMRPRIAETAKILWIIYSILTALCALAYWWAGMDGFDAICHSFSTVSIGGFSTHDASIGYFNNSVINWITVLFLFISGCNFALHFRAISEIGRENTLKIYWRDAEFRFFAAIQLALISVTFAFLYGYNQFSTVGMSLEQAAFQAVSISTTTGYTTDNFNSWPSFIPMLLIFSSFIGGCVGSTGGGLKVVRILVLWLQGKRELNRFVHPKVVHSIKLGQRLLPERLIEGIWAFFSAYLLVFILCFLGVIACGVRAFDAFNAVAACLNNLGIGLGSVSSNMLKIPDSAKWILTFAMICGRVEIFSVLVLLTPAFWKS
ncbi:trk system potassium uptake protein TrkH [Cricetibacter osteomyelitidis]|uniref:Trk system potassium uptake protein n=1 Tax=Cricetibacter osteomyelitidis TaxID=1521931 RepID=A0A4R2SGM3_9PAST|nr:TrkH family potassium uptake protein [Cricetibacter osteomyelitidis]TCP88797.1 trk system potassium uptake protein TrkH [Cricetibacter osteomyelitidis]